jgi:outer membrane receptor for ferrienterochelin and colicins
MLLRIKIIILFFGLARTLQAQNYFQLSILDTSNRSIPGAVVLVITKAKTQELIADEKGMVRYECNQKSANVNVQCIGYVSVQNLLIDTSIQNKKIVLMKTNQFIDEIVVTGSNKEIRQEQSIYKINIINAATIKKQAAYNLGDALQQQGGFFTQNDALLGSSINLQGISGQNIKILLNGMPMNGRENGNIDLRQVNLNNVERVEVIKGPMSSLYGTDALGGIINIITKTPSRRPRILFNQAAESIQRFNTHINGSVSLKRHGFTLGISRDIFLGYHTLDTFYRSMLWKPNETRTIDGQYQYQMAKISLKYVPTYSWQKVLNLGAPRVDPFTATAMDDQYYTSRWIHLLQAAYHIDSNRKFLIATSINNYTRIRERLYKDMTTLETTPVSNQQDTARFKDYNTRITFNTDWDDKINLLIGTELNHQVGQAKRIANQQQTFTDLAIFTSIPIHITKKIQIQPSLRISYNTLTNIPATPSLHYKQEINNSTSLRMSYARGYRAPSLKERYLYFVDQNHLVLGNDSLVPEFSNNFQFHIQKKLKKTPLSFSSTSYYNYIKNQIVLALQNPINNEYKYANIEKFRNICHELGLHYQDKKWNINSTWIQNYLFFADSGRGNWSHEINTNGTYSIPKIKSQVYIGYKYLLNQALISYADNGTAASYSSFLPPIHLLDVNLSRSFYNHRIQLQIGGKNLFNVGTVRITGAPLQGNHGNSSSQMVGIARNYFARVNILLAQE